MYNVFLEMLLYSSQPTVVFDNVIKKSTYKKLWQKFILREHSYMRFYIFRMFIKFS